MSKIDDLINKLCPDGVKFFELGEIATFSQGIQVAVNEQKYEKQDGFIRFLRIIDYTDNNEPPRYIKKPDDKYIKKENELIMIRYGTPGKVCIDYEGAIANNMFKINFNIDEINTKYMYYYLSQNSIYNKLSTSVKSTMPSINFGIVSKIIVAVPPLEVQCEIVRILDDFTLLSAELSAELSARKKQYEFYRNELLSFDENEKRVKLKDIIEFKNGKGHEKDIVLEGKYIVVNSKFISTNGEVKKYSNKQICPLIKDDILMVMSDLPNGRALAKCFIVDENDKYSLNQRIGCFHIKDTSLITTKFLFYVLNRNPQLLRYDNGVDQTNLRKDDILNIDIPIPDMKKQEYIANILDRFDKLCNDISEGLPAEIEARQKQYEFYRNKLLTFKELVNEG